MKVYKYNEKLKLAICQFTVREVMAYRNEAVALKDVNIKLSPQTYGILIAPGIII